MRSSYDMIKLGMFPKKSYSVLTYSAMTFEEDCDMNLLITVMLGLFCKYSYSHYCPKKIHNSCPFLDLFMYFNVHDYSLEI